MTDNNSKTANNKNDIYCSHYLLPNNAILNNPEFTDYFKQIKNPFYILNSNHICLHITDSIHYNVLTNNISFSLYNKYIKLTNQPEHSELIFKKLIHEFNINSMPNIITRKLLINNDYKYVIKDGCHRSSIILTKYPNININKYITRI